MSTNLDLQILNLDHTLGVWPRSYHTALGDAPATVMLFTAADVDKVADHFNVGVTLHNGMAHATVRIDGHAVVFAAPSEVTA